MPLLDRHSVAVVIPALNEALRIREVVTGALEHADRVILIDDGSDDGTVDQVADLPVTVPTTPNRCGTCWTPPPVCATEPARAGT